MPKKQTREAIEAEMNADEVERLIEDIEEFERRLQEVEKGWGIAPSPNEPLIDRMRAVGMSKKAIDGVSDMLEAMTRIALGKMDELPDRVRRVAEIADAEISALDQLWNLLHGRRALTVMRLANEAETVGLPAQEGPQAPRCWRDPGRDRQVLCRRRQHDLAPGLIGRRVLIPPRTLRHLHRAKRFAGGAMKFIGAALIAIAALFVLDQQLSAGRYTQAAQQMIGQIRHSTGI